MKTSYLSQILNILSGVLLLAILLRYLPPERFLQWLIFTSFGGLTVQLEAALSAICSRQIVRQWVATQDHGLFSRALEQTRRRYLLFAITMFSTMIVFGSLYFVVLENAGLSASWKLEWAVFSASYLVTYLFSHNCCALLASGNARSFATVNLITRTIYTTLSVISVILGQEILGLSVSMLITTIIGAVGMWLAVKRTTKASKAPAEREFEKTEVFGPSIYSQVFLNFIYVLLSYSVLRFGLIIDTGSGVDASIQAKYALAIQILSLAMIVAIVPINVLVAPLQKSVVENNKDRILFEITRISAYTNLVFIIAVSFVLITGSSLVAIIGGKVSLPSVLEMGFISFAMFVEINILIIINLLTCYQVRRFIGVYAVSFFISLAAGSVAWLGGMSLFISFGLILASIQGLFGLTVLGIMASRISGIGMGVYFLRTVKFIGDIVRHPIAVGIKYSTGLT